MAGSLKRLRPLLQDDTGSIGLFALMTFVVSAVIGGFAIDVTHFQATRTQLQVASDQAAHAALYKVRTMSPDDAKKVAIDLIQPLLPKGRYGAVITPDDIEFGIYDTEEKKFIANPALISAVQVTASMLTDKGNPAPTHLFKLIGIDDVDVRVKTIFMAYQPGCLREGLMADGVVDLQSNNLFADRFCVHSNSYVSLNQNNSFAPGTVVSMPNIADLDLPASGFKKNEGLEQALRNQRINLNVLNRLDGIETGLRSGQGQWVPHYITSPTVITGKANTLTQADLTPGRIHLIDCQSATLTIDSASTPLDKVVVLTSCPIKFANGSKLQDAVVLTTSTSDKAVSAPQGLQIGKNDNCAEGGGAQIITFGGFSVASKMAMFGGQVLAKGDVSFAANADGMQGASIVTRGVIDGTSNATMGFCLTGMEQNFEADYFRMVE